MIDRATIIKLAVGAVLIMAAAGAAGVLLREPLIQAGQSFIDTFGLVGLFVGVILTDASIVPLTNEPLVMLALTAGVSPWTAFLVTAAASVIAGPVGWAGGRLLGTRTNLVLKAARRQPQVVAMLTRYGARAVAAAAILPFPYAVATWLAGASGVPLKDVALASLLRIPKTAFYVALLAGGWALGG